MEQPFVYYAGAGAVLPAGVTRVRVDPSVRVIPPETFSMCLDLEELELCDGLREIGRRAFHGCRIMKFKVGTNIPRTVDVICDEAFASCSSLDRVAIPHGIVAIGRGTFRDCASLRRCAIPSTVRVIESDSFGGARLADGELPEGLERIGDSAFKDCRFRRMRVPPPVTVIGRHLFYSCARMVSLELPEGVRRIKNYAFMDCATLRNAVIPPHAGRGGFECFDGCHDLFELFGTNKGVKDALRGRFRGLPIHRTCYYHSYHDTRTTMEKLGSLMIANDDATATYANPSGSDRDCLGMTPLHILACSKRQDCELYEFLRENFGSRMRRYHTTEDRWGCLPVFYALLGDVPSSVRSFFVTELRRTAPDYVLDVRRLVENLCKCGATLDAVKYVLGARHEMFALLESVDWDQFVADLAASASAQRVPVKLFRFLIHITIYERVEQLGLEKWRAAIRDEVDRLPDKGNMRNTELKGIKLKLAFAEYTYDQLKEATFILELALWKAKINECNSLAGKKRSSNRLSNKRMRVDKEGFVHQCRISCGAEVIIRNVLPFLIENMI
jgi:hypothetical protein